MLTLSAALTDLVTFIKVIINHNPCHWPILSGTTISIINDHVEIYPNIAKTDYIFISVLSGRYLKSQ